MKQSNFDRMIEQYVSQKLRKVKPAKLKRCWMPLKSETFIFISDETEELLVQKIKDSKIQPEEIALFVKDLKLILLFCGVTMLV